MVIYEKEELNKNYNSKTLKKLHNIELMILSDFISICNENSLKYFATYGTALGAIRHEGFIPWDDDIDVIMYRKDYNKFLEIIKSSEKYDLFSMETNNNYFKTFGKLNLNGTYFDYPFLNKNIFFGINIDIFIIDSVPKNNIKKLIFIKRRKFNRKLSWLLEVLNNDAYLSKNKEKIGRFIKKIFDIIGINHDFLLKQHMHISNENKGYDEVCEINDGIIFPKEIFESTINVKFENLEICIPKDYDTYLKIIYGETYMELPPEEERFNHSATIDFGKYN